jgi:hypothetical protein
MLTLRELQAELHHAMLVGGDDQPAGALSEHILPDGLTVEARLALYRHHVLTTLTSALESTFPVVARLVGDGFFAYVADAYIRRHPPAGPCLFEYGESFAAFLAAFPACRDLVYLPDVARLEWAMNRAGHAEEVPRLRHDALRDVPAEATPALAFRVDPSVTLLASAWPIDRIWRANQPDADPEATVSLASGPVCLEIRRLDDDVVFRALPPDVHAFRAALADGQTLEQAADAALARAAAFDLAGALHAVLDDGLVVARA